MKISIAMATYNGALYLREQLDSFLGQTRLPDELIVSDDGSTDSTREIVLSYKITAPFPVIFIENEIRLGYAKNFERALLACTGDLIFLSDQDDWWYPHKIAKMEELAEDNRRASVFIHNARLSGSDLQPTSQTLFSQATLKRKSDGVKLGACMALRRSFAYMCLPVPPHSIGHDGWFSSIAAGLGEKLINDAELQIWRRNEFATSGHRLSNKLGRRMSVVCKWLNGEQLELLSIRTEFLIQAIETMLSGVLEEKRKRMAFRFLRELKGKSLILNIRRDARCNSRVKRIAILVKLIRSKRYESEYGLKDLILDCFAVKD
jgi:glycosyltransferase involved in cell wall biosynthesis